jgi:hypothetical protein
MARTRIENGVRVALTEEEETQRNLDASNRSANKVKREAMEEIYRLESTVTPRRIRAMTTADGAKWVDDVEKLIAIERDKL